MRLAVVYNVWDGEELLPFSVRQVEDLVDYVVLVVSSTSSFGEVHEPDLRWAKDHPKVHVERYEPTPTWHPLRNERLKRERGYRAAGALGATHFLFADCDELYVPGQFAAALRHVVERDLDATACRLRTYYKHPTCEVWPPEDYWVPWVHRWRRGLQVGGGVRYPVLCDPTRMVAPLGRFEALPEDLLVMHHFTGVRRDYARKVRNSSARANYDPEQLVERFCNFRFPKNTLDLPPLGYRHAPNLFHLPDFAG